MAIMQLTENIKNCNGCAACQMACKTRAVKMIVNEEGRKVPFIDEKACNKCNACRMYCPLYMPVELPEFKDWYEFDEKYMERDMAQVYRETSRSVKNGQFTEFVGTLCQIAALKSLMGDRLRPNLKLYPLACTPETQAAHGCKDCVFYK